MKLLKKSTLAMAMVSAAVISNANANPQQAQQTQSVKPAQAQQTAAKPVLHAHVDPKLNVAELQRNYPILKVENIESATELKNVKFNFEELLKASQFVSANYGKQAPFPEFNFVQITPAVDKKIKAKFEKLSGEDKQKYARSVNQALMQAPVLAYYEYLTTGQVPTQKDIYSLVTYQNQRYAKVRLLDLPVAATGKSEDALMNLLLTRITVPFDQQALVGWYNNATKMNSQPIKLDKPVSYGTLFTSARTNVAQAQVAQAQKAQAQQVQPGKTKVEAAKKPAATDTKQKS
ncbi:hypothetical protein [Acinetobacter sp. YH12153]|uniref:hypothetical protein n=1 Tax=Acinetobacter sp. YH12153 TaxID=2601133 RepID=UPI0015D37B2D|nr:hypothetical protein [Acinetobacter sp. YH12153]